MRIFAAMFALVAPAVAEFRSYEGCKVYRTHPSEKQVDLLASVRYSSGLDFWSPLRRDGTPIDVMVYPRIHNMFTEFMESNNIPFNVLVEDVERAISNERIHQSMVPSPEDGGISFTKYLRYYEINKYLESLHAKYPSMVELETIGKSYEGRDIKLVKISSNFKEKRPIIFIDAAIHAREWIAPSVALYIVHQLVEKQENLELLRKIDYHILPVVNPDGYEYTHKMARYWRKTRSPGEVCFGTDCNRNFNYHWGEEGSSSNECSLEYHGKVPFSEPETIALRDYVLNNKYRIKLYLTLHSHGQLILYPWGYTSELPEDSAELQMLGDLVADSIESVSGTKYTVGSSTDILYKTSGGSDDWVKGVAGVELTYTIELPPSLCGKDEFDPPPEDILPIVKETFEGIKVFSEYITQKFGQERNPLHSKNGLEEILNGSVNFYGIES